MLHDTQKAMLHVSELIIQTVTLVELICMKPVCLCKQQSADADLYKELL